MREWPLRPPRTGVLETSPTRLILEYLGGWCRWHQGRLVSLQTPHIVQMCRQSTLSADALLQHSGRNGVLWATRNSPIVIKDTEATASTSGTVIKLLTGGRTSTSGISSDETMASARAPTNPLATKRQRAESREPSGKTQISAGICAKEMIPQRH